MMDNRQAIVLLFSLWAAITFIQCKGDDRRHFSRIEDAIPTVSTEARYATSNNFMGRPVAGYLSDRLMLTQEAMVALAAVQADLEGRGYGLKVFDGYRPQRSVDAFVAWCADTTDTLKKQEYYPNLSKDSLLPQGYIAARSGHSRGSTVDLTVIDLNTGEELDMGTPFDFFGPESHGDFTGVTSEQFANRMLLREAMIRHGFRPLPEEWWHFTLEEEPFPDTYFDFVVD
jgi:D-alanyl-D-alanine dipeptidase